MYQHDEYAGPAGLKVIRHPVQRPARGPFPLRPARARLGVMAYDRQWIIDALNRLGYAQEADEAARALPAQVSAEELLAFGDQHGISRDELVSRMGGSP